MREINSKTLDLINTDDVDKIEIRTIGLLDVFGKMEIDIFYKNDTIEKLVAYSPVDTNLISNWLEKDNLYEKAKMYKF